MSSQSDPLTVVLTLRLDQSGGKRGCRKLAKYNGIFSALHSSKSGNPVSAYRPRTLASSSPKASFDRLILVARSTYAQHPWTGDACCSSRHSARRGLVVQVCAHSRHWGMAIFQRTSWSTLFYCGIAYAWDLSCQSQPRRIGSTRRLLFNLTS